MEETQTTPVFDDGSVARALSRVRNTLNYSLKSNYGIDNKETTEKFLKMHGLDSGRFDFLNNFEKLIEKGIADESVDTNANKSDVSITGLFSETAMPINKIVGYRYLYRTMKEMYGKKEAKRLSGLMYDMSIALADSTNILKPYSYYGHTLVYTSINGVERMYTLKDLFDRYSTFSNYDEENNMDVIYVEDIKRDVVFNRAFMKNNESINKWSAYNAKFDPKKVNEDCIVKENVVIKVWDDENGFVDVTRIVRHRRDKDMLVYQTNNGDFAFVTEDHPVFMADGSEKYACQLSIGDEILDSKNDTPETIANENTIEMTDKLAYFLGFILGDGNLECYDVNPETVDSPTGCIEFLRGGNLVSITQSDIKNSRIYKVASELFGEENFFKWHDDEAINPMTGKVYNKNDKQINFTSWFLNLLCSYYFEYGRKENSFTKHLPVNFMQWTHDAQDSFLAGLMDSDGSVTASGLCIVRLKAYSAINALHDVLKHRGIKVTKNVYGSDKNDIMFGVSFRPTEKVFTVSSKLQTVGYEKIFLGYNESSDSRPRDNRIKKIIRIDGNAETQKYKSSFLGDELEFVYDITTSTSRFVANGMIQHNCYSVNAQKLVFEGRPFGSLHSLPPKRVGSYIHSLCETIHQLSNHLAGAIAIGSFFLDIAYVMLFREGKTLEDLKAPIYRKYVENEMQSFVHSMNHLSRNSTESPFSNVSIFDRPKLKSLLDDDNLGWYYSLEPADELATVPEEAMKEASKLYNTEVSEENHEAWIDYVTDTILELEDIFMDVMDKGDVAHDNRPITFPVTTCNISRGKDENGNYKFEDPDFVDHICKNHDIMRYNIYISEGNKVASCCMSYNTYFNFYDEKGNPVNMTLGDYVETRLGLEGDLKNFEGGKVFANRDANARLDGKETIRGMNGTIIPITGVSRLVNQFKKLIKITFVGGDVLWVTPNQEFVLRNGGKIEAKDLIAGSLLYKEVEVASVDTFDSDDYVYDIEVGSDDHLFKLKLPKCGKNVSVSNCRLINDSDLFELGGQVNSFGGTSLSLGSHRVATINLRRISLECDSFEDYKKRLTKRMEDAADILIAHRHLLKELVAKGTQPFIDNGWLDLDRMFSTFGIMGYYEAAKDMEKRFGGDVDYIGEIIAYIDSESRRISGERKNVFNVEEIPGETMSAKLANTDRWIYGEELVPEPMYTNQFVPLWEETTLSEKFKEEGRLTAKLTGGGICHYSLGEKLTAKQYRSVIEKALESGLEHFALNPSYSVDSNGHFTLGDYKVCPKCGAPITDHLSRTVGFFVFTSNMTKTKREEDFEKRHYKGI